MLPPRLTSLYRLTQRVLSAAVLHHSGATRSLRALYRPVFEDAARVAKALESDGVSGERERWWAEWEERMNNTLSLHVLSARPFTSRLPSRLTRNLALLRFTRLAPLTSTSITTTVRWNAAQPAYAAAKHGALEHRPGLAHRRMVFDACDRVLGEATRAAEGRCGVVLGRVENVKGRRARRTEGRRMDAGSVEE